MKRKGSPGLRDMTPQRAVARCVEITTPVWSNLDEDSGEQLFNIMRAYILNGYKDTGEPVTAHIADAWDRCKQIIDREAGL